MDETVFDKLGGRKFVLTLIMIAVGTAVELLTERGMSEAYVMFLAAIGGVFSAANAAVSWKGMSVGGPAAESGERPAAPASQDVESVKQEMAAIAAGTLELNERLTAVEGTQATQGESITKITGLLKGLLTIKQG